MLIDESYEKPEIIKIIEDEEQACSDSDMKNIIIRDNRDAIRDRSKYGLKLKDSYCGNYYGEEDKYKEKLKSLGKDNIEHDKPYCPIKLVSKLYAYKNIMKIKDIPKGLFNKSPLDEFLSNDKSEKFLDKLGNRLSIIDNANVLNKAFNDYNKGDTKHKESVQRYRANQLRNELEIIKKIESGKYKPTTAKEFKLTERGKVRYIKAPSIVDQVVQRSINDNLLIPTIRPKLIYNNGASLKNKGISFTRSRFENDLRCATKEFGRDKAYIILIDFTKYFDNIFHNKLKEMLSTILTKEQVDFISIFIDEFNIDLSYMDDDDFNLIDSIPFNCLEYNEYINNNPDIKQSLNKSKILERSMGIGNHIAQISGVYYPTKFDNYITKVKGCKYYGRYMDDTYIIVNSKETAKSLLSELYNIAEENGLFINKKKTKIEPIYNWITFLKIKYLITDTYKIIRKPVSDTFKREYNRITKFHKLYLEGKMALEHIIECYRSWRGSYSKFDCGYEIKNLDDHMRKLFALPFNYKF